MAARSYSISPAGARSGVLPPWLWFWLILYIVGFPALFESEKSDFLIVLTGSDGTSTLAYTFVERWISLGVVLNDLVVFIGVLIVFLPWLRMYFLERQYELADLTALPARTAQGTRETLGEVSNFVHMYAPNISIKYSVMMKEYAFVYPLDYRRIAVAISASLLPLWRRDRLAAQAILLHEMGHYRHGDAFIVGEGSLFETVIRYLVPFNLIFIVLPLLVPFGIEHITSIHDEAAILTPVQTSITYHLQQIVTFDIPVLLLAVLQSLFRVGVVITLALAAIWCAELNADRFVMDTTQSIQTLDQAMKQHSAPASWWRWLLLRTTHPPVRMRLWLVRQSQNRAVLLLLVFPVAAFVRLFFLLGWASGNYLLYSFSTGLDIGFISSELSKGVIYYFEGLIPIYAAMTLLFLLWPFLTRLWERLFARIPGQPGYIKYRSYLTASGVVACVCLIGLGLSLLPTPSTATAKLNSQTGTVVSSPVATGDSGTTKSSSGHFQVGEQVKVADMWLVQITQAQIQPDNGLMKAPVGQAYLAIDVSLKNISSQTYTFSSSTQFTLQDLQGKQYDQTFIAAVLPPEASTPAQDGRVAAGGSMHGRLTYEIPASLHQFTLSFKADWLNYDPTTSQLTIWDINAS